MKINGYTIKAAIFDLDGTLLDSGNVWKEIDIDFFKKRGMEVPKGYGESIGHIGLTNAAIYTKENYFPNESADDIYHEWQEAALYKYQHEIKLNKGAFEFLQLLKQNNIPCVVVTANDEACFLSCLKNNHIDDCFIDYLEVKKYGLKSSPVIFNKALELLNSKPEDTFVFDDLFVPLETAKSINLKTCFVKSPITSEVEKANKIAEICINDFTEIRCE